MDQAIDNEANIDRQIRHEAPTASQTTGRGTSAAILAAGAIAPDAPDEETPLLSGERNDADASSSRRSSSEDRSDAHTANEWPGLKDFEGLPWYKQPSIFYMLAPYIVFMLAFGGIIVPKVNLVQDLLCRDYYAKQALLNPDVSYPPIAFYANDDQCTVPEVEASAASFTMATNIITGLLSAFTSPKLGALSDRYGRLRVLVLSSFGMLMSEVITIFAATNPDTFSVYWMLFGAAFDGICGSYVAGMALSMSYAADCSPPSRRNVAFGYFHGCLFTGIAIGPLIAAAIMETTSATVLTLFYICLGCHVFFIACLTFLVPESVSKKRQMAARKKYAAMHAESSNLTNFQRVKQQITTMFEPLKTLYPTGPGSSPALRRNLVVLAAIDTTAFGVAMGALSVIIIYMRKQFDWNPADQSIFISVANISRVAFLFIILPTVVRLVRGPAPPKTNGLTTTPLPHQGCDRLDIYIMRVGVAFDLLGFIGYSLSRDPRAFTVSAVVASAGGIASPTLQSSMTKHLPHNQAGQLLGASGLLHALARVLAPIIFTSIFKATVDGFRQAVFVSLASAFGVAFLLTWILRPGVFLLDPDAAGDTSTESAPEIQRHED